MSAATTAWVTCFDPHPREGATRRRRAPFRPVRSFDPHPREGATVRSGRDQVTGRVSIRTPVRGRPGARPMSPDWVRFRSAPP